MLLGPPELTDASQDRSHSRWAMLNETLASFQAIFPGINIRILDEISFVNAQASHCNGERMVDIFGGLAFHPAVGGDALNFSLLHEIGHHLGCGARMIPGSPLACDCASDYWAISRGLPVLVNNNTKVHLERAMNQLEEALSPSIDSIDQFRSKNANCWCWDWPRRKHHLSTGAVPIVERCCMFSGQEK
jgi:hypothetical protein